MKNLVRRLITGLLQLQCVAATLAADTDVFVQTAHSIVATRAVFAPGGEQVAVCDASGRVALWDPTSGRKLRELERHTGLCLGLAYSSDGVWLASTGGARSGNEIAIHRLSDGTRVALRHGHKGIIRGLAMAIDGKSLWSLGETDGLKLWSLTGSGERPLREIDVVLPDAPNAELTSLALDPRAPRLWVGRADGRILTVDVGGTEPRVTLLAHLPDAIAGIDVSPRGEALAVTFGGLMGSRERGIRLLSSSNGDITARLEVPQMDKPGVILSAAFSPDGARVAGVSMVDFNTLLSGPSSALQPQETLTVWSRTGEVIAHVGKGGHVNGLPFMATQVRFDPKGERLAVAAWDVNPRLYALARGQLSLTHTLQGRGLAARHLAAVAHAPLLVTADAQSGQTRATVRLTAQDARREFDTSAGWTAAREQRLREVYSVGAETAHLDRASVWNLQTGKLERVVSWQRAPVTHLAADQSGDIVSFAPTFPNTVLLSPLKINLIREARFNARNPDDVPRLAHFDPDPAAADPMDVFLAPAGSAERTSENTLHTTRVTASASGRWVALAMQPTGLGANPKRVGHKLMLMSRTDRGFMHRREIDMPGEVLAMALSANDTRLWVTCGTAGLAQQSDYEAQLMAFDLPTGLRVGAWALRKGVTPDTLAVSADGSIAYTSGESRVAAWAVGAADAIARYEASTEGRPVTALAMSSGGRRLVAADTTGYLTAWDTASGQSLWSLRISGASPHTLAYVREDTRIAAASGDGTVHIIDALTGAPIARLIRFDNEEWITITPEGYFTASANGDQWLNVRLGNTVHGIDQFFDVFYRPDIVERKLAGEDITPLITVTLEQALREPPPRVTIAVRETSHGQVRVGYTAQSAGGRVGEVRIFHNGKLIATHNPRTARPTARDKLAGNIDVTLVGGENLFTVVAFNAANTLNARPVSGTFVGKIDDGPRRVVLFTMGINEYAKSAEVDHLRFAVKDAGDFAQAVTAAIIQGDAKTQLTRIDLRDRDATREGVRRTFDELARGLKPSDIFIWFVAGHGMLDKHAQYGIIPHDWNGKPDPDALLSAGEILDASRKLPALTQFFVFDTCHAGGLTSLALGLYDARLAVLARNMGLHIFASASATEEAIDGYQGNGLFTHTLLKGLSGAADTDGDKRVTVNELGRYASAETARIARSAFRHAQQPSVMSYGRDWTLQSFK